MGRESVGAEGEGFDLGEEDGVFGFLCGEGGGCEGEEGQKRGVEDVHFARVCGFRFSKDAVSYLKMLKTCGVQEDEARVLYGGAKRTDC